MTLTLTRQLILLGMREQSAYTEKHLCGFHVQANNSTGAVKPEVGGVNL